MKITTHNRNRFDTYILNSNTKYSQVFNKAFILRFTVFNYRILFQYTVEAGKRNHLSCNRRKLPKRGHILSIKYIYIRILMRNSVSS